MTTLTVDVVSDIRTLVTLEPAWWSLWHRSRATTPFQAPAWLIPWWRAFGAGELFAVIVWHQARLVGMAPLQVESTSAELRLLPLGISASSHIDVLADAAWETDVLDALVAFLANCPTRWSVWDMPDVPADGLAPRLRRLPGWDDAAPTTSSGAVLTLPAQLAGLDAAIPARTWRHIQLARQRAGRHGTVAIRRAEPASAEAAIRDLFRLQHARCDGRSDTSGLSDPRLVAFHGEAIPKLMRTNLLRMYTLSIGGVTAAVYYGMAHGGRHYAYQCEVDPAFERESAGTILIAHAIEDAVREGVAEFHFRSGGERFNDVSAWGAVDRGNQRRVISRRLSHARAS